MFSPISTEFFNEMVENLNQIYVAMLVFFLNALAQLNTNSPRTYLQIGRYLKAVVWKSVHIWIRKIKGKDAP